MEEIAWPMWLELWTWKPEAPSSYITPALIAIGIFFLPAFLDTGRPRGNVHERDSGPVRGAIPTQSHNP